MVIEAHQPKAEEILEMNGNDTSLSKILQEPALGVGNRSRSFQAELSVIGDSWCQ